MKTYDVFAREYESVEGRAGGPKGPIMVWRKSVEDTIESDLTREAIPLEPGFLWQESGALSKV